MKASVSIIFLLGSFFTSFSQDLAITPEIQIRSSTKYKIVGRINETVMLMVEENGFYKIHAFTEEMTKKWDRPLKMEKKVVKISGFIPRENDFSVYYTYRHKGLSYLNIRRLDEKLNIVDSTVIKKIESLSFTPTIHFETSKNKKKALMYYVENSNKFTITVIDNDSMTTDLDMEFKTEDFTYERDFLQAVVDNNGGVYMIFEKDNQKSKRETNIFKVFYFNPTDKQIRFFDISLKEHLWHDVHFDTDNINNRLLAMGFYSDETILEAQGIFFMSVSPERPEEIISNFEPFSKEYLSLVFGKEVKKNIGMSDAIVQQLVPRQDGGGLMIGERYKEENRNRPSTGVPERGISTRNADTPQTDYFYNEILLYSFHPNGQIHWVEVLHKKQYSSDDNGVFSSFFLFLNKAKIRFLYNDTVKRNDTVYEYIVTGNGEFERKSLFNTKEDELMLRLPDAVQISSNVILVPSELRGSVKLVKMTFK
jgi:hypothetical protein